MGLLALSVLGFALVPAVRRGHRLALAGALLSALAGLLVPGAAPVHAATLVAVGPGAPGAFTGTIAEVLLALPVVLFAARALLQPR